MVFLTWFRVSAYAEVTVSVLESVLSSSNTNPCFHTDAACTPDAKRTEVCTEIPGAGVHTQQESELEGVQIVRWKLMGGLTGKIYKICMFDLKCVFST